MQHSVCNVYLFSSFHTDSRNIYLPRSEGCSNSLTNDGFKMSSAIALAINWPSICKDQFQSIVTEIEQNNQQKLNFIYRNTMCNKDTKTQTRRKIKKLPIKFWPGDNFYIFHFIKSSAVTENLQWLHEGNKKTIQTTCYFSLNCLKIIRKFSFKYPSNWS